MVQRSTPPKPMGILIVLLLVVVVFQAQRTEGQYYCNDRNTITAQWGGCNGTYAVCSNLMQAITTTWNWWSTVNNTNGSSLGVAVHNYFTTYAYTKLLIITNNNTAYPTICKKIAAIVAQLLSWNATADASVPLGNASFAAPVRQELFNTVIPGWGYTIGQYVACGSTCTNYTSTTSTTSTTTTARTSTSTTSTTTPTTTTSTRTSTTTPTTTTSTTTSTASTTTTSTVTPTTTTISTTTTTTACIPPTNKFISGVLIGDTGTSPNNLRVNDGLEAGSCSCNDNITYTFFEEFNDTSVPGPVTFYCIPSFNEQMCACDAQRVCYETQVFGVNFVNMYTSCDAEGCLNYLVLNCEGYGCSSCDSYGLATAGTMDVVWSCKQQGTATPTLGRSLGFINPVSISCGACATPIVQPTCSGDYTPRGPCACNVSSIAGIGVGDIAPIATLSSAAAQRNCTLTITCSSPNASSIQINYLNIYFYSNFNFNYTYSLVFNGDSASIDVYCGTEGEWERDPGGSFASVGCSFPPTTPPPIGVEPL